MGYKGASRLSLLLSFLVFLTSFSGSTSRSVSSSPNPVTEKVSVELYYETLCPDSVDFILNHLVKLFDTGLVSIVDLKLLPYGNARLRSNSTIVCQVYSFFICSSLHLKKKKKKERVNISDVPFYPTAVLESDLTHYPIFSGFSSSSSSSMAFSGRAISQCIFLSCLVLFASFCPSPTWASVSESGKVSLGLYYESLCPYSANFVVNYLVKLFEDDLISIVDLNLVPWGNAKIRGNNNTVVCQHGPYECLLNTVEACAIDIWPELSKHFPFIYCIEKLVLERKYLQWESCFEKLNLDPEPVTECYTGEYGKELELQYAAETDALQPPHEYVPWVVVDGQPLYEDYENFLSYICKAYKGTAAQTACNKLSLNTMNTERAKPGNPVCYKEEEKMPTTWARVRSAIMSWIRPMNVAAFE